jgi:hypothetical protein
MIDSCTSAKERFTSKLRSAIQDASKNDASTFTMVGLTDFTWDALFIFGPYTPVSEIEKALGFAWPPAKKSGIAKCFYNPNIVAVFDGHYAKKS